MRFGSLFSGIGGMDLGLGRAGFQCAWQIEIDEYATRVLTKHWPNVPKFRDVRECGARNLGPVDLIAGGFPCQDISNAGKRAGIDGERSGLWSEFHRIICELRPRYVLVENVAALLVRGMDRVLGDLSEIGYDAEWDCIPAASVGAPHRRNRVFIVAYASSQPKLINHDGRGVERSGTATPARALDLSSKGCGANVENPVEPGLEGHERVFVAESLQRRYHANSTGPGWWAVEPELGRVAHGIPKRVDRLRGLGNAVVPQVATWVGERILKHDKALREVRG